MLVAVSLLVISISILLYRHPPSTWRSAPQDEPATQQTLGDSAQSDDANHSAAEPHQKSPDELEFLDRAESPSPQTTPKALGATDQNTVSVPTFTLAEHEESKNEEGAVVREEKREEEDEDEDEEDNMPPPSFPAMNSAQRASGPGRSAPALMGPPLLPQANTSSRQIASPSLMPPPSIKPSSLRPLPSAGSAQGLRAPAAGLLPNRGPVPSRTPGSGLGVPPTQASVKTPNARGKILLSPGHSPLDWANLQRSGTNLSGVPSLIRVTPSMLKHNNGRKGKPAWSSYQGKVYNITPYLPFHPGGEGELRRAAGKDGGKLFMEVHPWVNWENMLGECLVGILVSEPEPESQETPQSGGSLEDMD